MQLFRASDFLESRHSRPHPPRCVSFYNGLMGKEEQASSRVTLKVAAIQTDVEDMELHCFVCELRFRV